MNRSYNALDARAVSFVQQQIGANAALTCTMPATAGWLWVLQKVSVTGGGATAAALVDMTTTGLETPVQWAVPVVAGPTNWVGQQDSFTNGVKAAAVGGAVTVTLPAFGAGNTDATLRIEGYRVPA